MVQVNVTIQDYEYRAGQRNHIDWISTDVTVQNRNVNPAQLLNWAAVLDDISLLVARPLYMEQYVEVHLVFQGNYKPKNGKNPKHIPGITRMMLAPVGPMPDFKWEQDYNQWHATWNAGNAPRDITIIRCNERVAQVAPELVAGL